MVNELALKKLWFEAAQMMIDNSNSDGASAIDYVCKDVLVECGDYDFRSEMVANIKKNMGGHGVPSSLQFFKP